MLLFDHYEFSLRELYHTGFKDLRVTNGNYISLNFYSVRLCYLQETKLISIFLGFAELAFKLPGNFANPIGDLNPFQV